MSPVLKTFPQKRSLRISPKLPQRRRVSSASIDHADIFPRQSWLGGFVAVSATARLLEITDDLVEADLRFLIMGGHAVRINNRIAARPSRGYALAWPLTQQNLGALKSTRS
jgi:hypothetical protein